MAIRFRTRFLHATMTRHVREELRKLGWIDAPVNFATTPVTVVDVQPDERDTAVKDNTVAVTLGDVPESQDEELGAAAGGISSIGYVFYIDIYMREQSLSVAIADDLRDIVENKFTNVVDQITGQVIADAYVAFENVMGPDRPDGAGADNFRKYWRIVRGTARLYYRN